MKLTKVFFGLVGCLLASSLAGCVIESSEDRYAGHGSLTLDTTINGSNRASECAFYDIDELEVTVRDDAGREITTTTAPCESFGLTIDNLAEGEYSVDATLLDASGRPVSDTLVVDGLDVRDGADLSFPLDFPSHLIH